MHLIQLGPHCHNSSLQVQQHIKGALTFGHRAIQQQQ